MKCLCGQNVGRAYTRHIINCDAFWDKLHAEVRRISETFMGGGTVSARHYEEYRKGGFPEARTIIRVRRWNTVLTDSAVPLYVVQPPKHRRPCKRLPPVDDHWPDLLQGHQFISPYASKESLYALVTRMVEIAEYEAEGHLSHHTTYSTTAAEKELIRQDAQAFLQEWREAA